MLEENTLVDYTPPARNVGGNVESGRRDVPINLQCPKCNSESTEKISLAMGDGGAVNTMARFGGFYLANFVVPLLALLIAIPVAFFGGIAGSAVFGHLGIVFAAASFLAVILIAYYIRKTVVIAMKPKYAALRREFKQNGFVCNRCAHTFIPGA